MKKDSTYEPFSDGGRLMVTVAKMRRGEYIERERLAEFVLGYPQPWGEEELEYVARYIAGKITRRRGRPKRPLALADFVRDFQIWLDVRDALARSTRMPRTERIDTPKQSAIGEVAEEWELSEDQIDHACRRVMERLGINEF